MISYIFRGLLITLAIMLAFVGVGFGVGAITYNNLIKGLDDAHERGYEEGYIEGAHLGPEEDIHIRECIEDVERHGEEEGQYEEGDGRPLFGGAIVHPGCLPGSHQCDPDRETRSIEQVVGQAGEGGA